ncbi:transglutaminase superfamily protein [Anseongella ginsenosidimutans]|uniref:Transglutaminase superfamily protein n=1 Tax=Anseongella ginsenosidimutans TaxID=496056 RepID=A0A4R3KRT8_9SPHI|nr:DUF3857 domain-containing protein [Anseongella ginsenosidimutans]QEC52842.1 DUF3857 domain-containing protein [Anseongella ginsenosidimutans]TCS87227.1 transglutaminase superfamily protein [Anseongella ginsenosidimutans]
MRKIYLFIFFSVIGCLPALSQLNPVQLGRITLRDLQQNVYPDDTAAHAVILKETGESFLDNERELKLVFHYYGKIKIQDASGLEAANIVIPLYKGEQGDEAVFRIQAFAYNLEGGRIVKTELSYKDIYEEDISEHVTLKKFTFPNARPGSVLEYTYELHSPYLFNFRDWLFQHDIPTVRSEYWARIPGNFIYNMRLVGPFELSLNESSISKGCFRAGGGVADCAVFKWAMDSIPAFVREDYMTAPSDYMPAVRFELSEVRRFDGQVDKITKTWKDLEMELKTEKSFGLAIKRASEKFSSVTALLTAESKNDLEKARKIYAHFRERFEWNGERRYFVREDLDKSYASGSGSAADVNLGLVAALQSAGLEAHPFLLSTRDNGYPVDIHPVISDFNYVTAYLRIGEKTFLLDATENFLPFGMLPFRCLSNKGRVMDFEHSFWMDIPSEGKLKEVTQLRLTLDSAAQLKGSYTSYKYDYGALSYRNKMAEIKETSRYVRELEEDLDGVRIMNYRNSNLDSLESRLIEEYEVEVPSSGRQGGNIYLPVMLLNKIDENPFKLRERYYPVNFGAGWEIQNLVQIRLPENYQAVSLPEPVGISLPAGGGSFIMNMTGTRGQVNIFSKIELKKAVYSPQEYYYVKEMFSRIVKAHAATIVLEPIK